MSAKSLSFSSLFIKDNKIWLIVSLLLSFSFFLFQVIVFPFPNLYPDSYTYIQCARDNQMVSYRPIEFSRFIAYFKTFSESPFALIFFQTLLNYIAHIFLFFTVLHHFNFTKISKWILFLLLFLNPISSVLANSILSDSLFTSFAVIWFTLLIWMVKTPKWYLFVLQTIILIFLFKLRYHGIVFPIVLFIAVLMIKIKLWEKVFVMVLNVLIIYLLVNLTIQKNDEFVRVKTFSAFSGWQMANNALHILQHKEIKIDTTHIAEEDTDTKPILNLVKKYFDTAKNPLLSPTASAIYIWNVNSPLKQFVPVYMQQNSLKSFFDSWQNLGPVYNKFGSYIIFQHPLAYFNYFVLPNINNYFKPDLEAINTYCVDADTIPPVVVNYYGYKTNKIPPKSKLTYHYLISQQSQIFTFINVVYLIIITIFLIIKRKLFNSFEFKISVIMLLFFLVNFGFIVLLAPSVYRYNLFILILLFPFIIYTFQVIFSKYLLLNKQSKNNFITH